MSSLAIICFFPLFIGIRSTAGMNINSTVGFALEPKIIESNSICPVDSIPTEEGACTCNYEICKKPECDKVLHLSGNYTDLPGKCCPTYTCNQCSPDYLVDGKCPCAPEAYVNDDGQCICEDPYRSLKGNVCICDVNKCELPGLCNETSVRVKVTDGCCTKVKCLRCPTDSFGKSYQSDDVEDICVCYPCSPKICDETETPVVVLRGKNIPGKCCDVYKCETKSKTGKQCKVGNYLYVNGDTWLTPDSGNCTCQNGVSLCKTDSKHSSNFSCTIGSTVYPHLITWVEDTCTNCTCYNGKPKCIAHMCHVNISEIKIPNCPPLSGCKKSCELGFKTKKGCDICKCKVFDKTINSKYPFLETFMENLNISENETVLLLQEQLNIIDNAKSVTTVTSPPADTAHGPASLTHTEGWATRILMPIITFVFGCFCCYVIIRFLHFCKNNSYKYAPVKKPIENNNTADVYYHKNFELQNESNVKCETKIPLN